MSDTQISVPKIFITSPLTGFSRVLLDLGAAQPLISHPDNDYCNRKKNECLILKWECDVCGAHIFSDSYLGTLENGCKQLKNVSYCSSSETQLSEKSKDLITDFRLEAIADCDFVLCVKWNEQFTKDELMELSFAISLDKFVVIVKSPGVLVPERLKDSSNCSIITDRDELRGLKTGFLTGFSSLE